MEDIVSYQTASLSIIDQVDINGIQKTMQKITQLQAVVQSTLKKGHDYGVIPGTNKPTLLKPGAEKILMMFGLISEYEFLDRTEDYENGFFAYTLKCILSKNGQKITEGLGQANTKESRYRWRWVSENKLPDGVLKDTLVSRVSEGKYGEYTEYKIENEDPYTLANTALKMAKKRAQVDAVLTVASLSEIFIQEADDIKDLLQSEQIENMTESDASNITLTFGRKHKGKKLGEILKIDKSYIEWLTEKAIDPVLRKACFELLELDVKSNDAEKTEKEDVKKSNKSKKKEAAPEQVSKEEKKLETDATASDTQKEISNDIELSPEEEGLPWRD